MRIYQIILFSLLLFLISCGAPKTVVNYQQLASDAMEVDQYSLAIEHLQKYISQQVANEQIIDPKVYAELGKAYFKSEQYEKAEESFDRARDKNYADGEMYVMMSQRYRSIDNLSKEITALEYYRDHLSPTKDSSQMRNRLFETYVISENWQKAENTWSLMDSTTKEKGSYLQYYFDLKRELEDKEACDALAEKLLNIYPKSGEALEWLAKKYYYLAENRYQSSMETYNEKKTNKQYKILLKELDMVTADFKKSLKYFEPLWEMEDGKKYAVYLANIYARFDDKKKSDYYKSFLD